MKHYLTVPVLFLATSLIGNFATYPAQAQIADNCGTSFMMLPDGNCLNLGYMPVLGGSRTNLAEANDIYQRQYNANLQLEILYNQYPAYVSETEEERNTRYENLAETGIFRDKVDESNQRIENDLYPLHVQAMYIVGESFHRNPSWANAR